MGSKTTTTTNKVELPGWLNSASQQAVQMGTTIANRPYQAYTGESTAGLSDNQVQAGNLSQTGFTAGNKLMQQGAAEAESATPWSSATTDQQAAYEKPYIDNVVNPAVAQENKTYQGQSDNLNRSANASAAWGADNPVLARQALDTNLASSIKDTKATGQANAYDFAQNQWNTDQQLKTSKGSALVGAGTSLNQATQQQIQSLSTTGAAQQAVKQAQDNFDFSQFTAAQNWAPNNLNTLVNALSGIGGQYGARSSSTSTPSGAAGQIVGAAGAIAGAYFANSSAPNANTGSVGGLGAGSGADTGGAGVGVSDIGDIGGGEGAVMDA